jgi:hypothetical protein
MLGWDPRPSPTSHRILQSQQVLEVCLYSVCISSVGIQTCFVNNERSYLLQLGSFPFLTKYPERTLDRWAKKFGDLYSMWLGNQLFVIISDPQVAKDLMVTNGNVFSSRKEMYIKSQTVFAGRGITATPYNDRWSVNPLPLR